MLPPPAQLSSNLPIIQKATEAYKMWHEFHNKFPRLSKFSLGQRLDDLFVEMMENLFLARYASGERKIDYLNIAATKHDLLKFLLQVAWEIQALNHKRFATLSEPISEIGKMIGGWQNDLRKNAKAA
jgi:hypothetical protein